MTATTATAGTSRSHTPKNASSCNPVGGPTRDFPAISEKNGGNLSERLVDASVLAKFLGVSRAFVYEHADELGAIPLGAGPKPRLRFDRDLAVERLTTCCTGRGSESAAVRMAEPKQPRRRRASLDSGVELLPIRGQRVPREMA